MALTRDLTMQKRLRNISESRRYLNRAYDYNKWALGKIMRYVGRRGNSRREIDNEIYEWKLAMRSISEEMERLMEEMARFINKHKKHEKTETL